MALDSFEDTINDLTDRDMNWWPFLWLRPEKDASLTLMRVASLSVLYGVPCGVILGMMSSVLRHAAIGPSVMTALAFPLLCLFTGSVIVAPMWNRRAERLRTKKSR